MHPLHSSVLKTTFTYFCLYTTFSQVLNIFHKIRNPKCETRYKALSPVIFESDRIVASQPAQLWIFQNDLLKCTYNHFRISPHSVMFNLSQMCICERCMCWKDSKSVSVPGTIASTQKHVILFTMLNWKAENVVKFFREQIISGFSYGSCFCSCVWVVCGILSYSLHINWHIPRSLPVTQSQCIDVCVEVRNATTVCRLLYIHCSTFIVNRVG